MVQSFRPRSRFSFFTLSLSCPLIVLVHVLGSDRTAMWTSTGTTTRMRTRRIVRVSAAGMDRDDAAEEHGPPRFHDQLRPLFSDSVRHLLAKVISFWDTESVWFWQEAAP